MNKKDINYIVNAVNSLEVYSDMTVETKTLLKEQELNNALNQISLIISKLVNSELLKVKELVDKELRLSDEAIKCGQEKDV